MMWKRLCRAVLFCLFSTAAFHAAAQGFSSVVVFGDSLSDTGNFAHLTNADFGVTYPGTSFNYGTGRFTDDTATTPAAHSYTGVWVEQIAAHFNTPFAVKDSLDGGTNYAYGDATTADGTSTITITGGSITIANMGQQVANYLATKPTPNASTLYVVFGGANDLFADSSQTGVAAAAQREANLVQILINAGATNFVVPNLPPLGSTPQYAGTTNAAALNTASSQFGTLLFADLQAVITASAAQGMDVNITQVDLYDTFNALVANPTTYGFTNVTTSAQGLASTINPDTYVFWDDLHPTTGGHHVIASTAESLLSTLLASTTALTVTGSTSSSSITFTAAVSGSGTTKPTGGVTFFSGTPTSATAIASATLDGTGTGTATFSGTAPSTVFAVYMGDLTYLNSASSPQSIGTAEATSTSLSASSSSINVGDSLLLTATVIAAAGMPTGTVTFSDGTTALGTGTLNGSGTATFTTTTLAAGSHSITAGYAATGAYAASTSSAVTVVVTAPSISLSFSPSTLTVQHGSSGSAILTVTPAGGATGTISLACGAVPTHASCMFSPATLTLSGSAAQTSTLTIATNVAELSLPPQPGARPNELFFALALLPLSVVIRRKFVRKLLLVVAMLGVISLGATGCGGTPNPTTTTPGTYSITVNATLTSSTGTTTQAQTLSIVVQ
jgi:phospholipase/lecithinase/hemolysin